MIFVVKVVLILFALKKCWTKFLIFLGVRGVVGVVVSDSLRVVI
jgi:hypothetical protein